MAAAGSGTMHEKCVSVEQQLAAHLVQQHRGEAHNNLHLTKLRFDVIRADVQNDRLNAHAHAQSVQATNWRTWRRKAKGLSLA